MDVNDCFKKRILRKISPNLEKANSSIKIAEAKLEEAKKLFGAGFFNNSVLSVYTSMFHAVRAILYKEGIQEKSHYATYVYINEKYSDKIPQHLINSFNILREDRHEILYGFDLNILKEDAENAILDSEEFLEEVKKIYEKTTGF
ncbi:HEPN domain-containing protein [Candidatus Pacearchaeota archaeon]|nr:HEPN domain-containing protein [Candidatus Pacearchaeota archaeon]